MWWKQSFLNDNFFLIHSKTSKSSLYVTALVELDVKPKTFTHLSNDSFVYITNCRFIQRRVFMAMLTVLSSNFISANGHILVSAQCVSLFAFLAKSHYFDVNLHSFQEIVESSLVVYRFNFPLIKSLCETMTKIAHYNPKSCYMEDIPYLYVSIFELSIEFIGKYGFEPILMDWLFENIQSGFLENDHFMYCYDKLECFHAKHGGYVYDTLLRENRESISTFKRICKCLIKKMNPYVLYMGNSIETKRYYYVFQDLFLIKLKHGKTMKILLNMIQSKQLMMNSLKRVPLEMIRMLKDFLI